MTVKKSEVVEMLRRSNPDAREQTLQLYAQSFVEYVEAQANVEANGTVCAHPRTGQPMENPFCRVKSKSMADMTKLAKSLDTDPLWKWLEFQSAPPVEVEG